MENSAINFYFLDTDAGFHWLGGEVPNGFTLPQHDGLMPFQYIGFISNMDQTFGYLPFDLHIVFPIYLDVPRLFIDYSNPKAPILLNKEDVDKATSAFDDISKDSIVTFEKAFFNPVADEGYSFGHTAVPNWFQDETAPICPKSGREMMFVCQLGSSPSMPITHYTNVKAKEDYEQEYFQQMNFWGDGCLFVFFEPQSKIACMFISNS